MSVKSWHDSDDVDSDVECEAYNKLYYDISKKNKELYNDNILFKDEPNESKEDNETVKNKNEDIIVISDSDDSVNYVPKKVFCSNKISSLYIGASSSDDSDYEQIKSKMNNSQTSSFILNMTSNSQTFTSKKTVNSKKSFNSLNESQLEDWSVDSVNMKPKSRDRNRYFDIKNGNVCDTCLKKGHSQAECTRTGPVCILCGKEGHISNECNDLICHVCFQTDHLARKCPSTSNFLRQGCKRCGQRGHSEQICPDLWRQYKYTVTSGQPPVIQTCSSQNKNRVFCANCSRIGHFTDQCPRNRMSSKFLGPPPIMEIIRFDNTDIYESSGLSYVNSTQLNSENNSSESFEEIDPMIVDMDVTGIINDGCFKTNIETESDIEKSDSKVFEIDNKNSSFGVGYIMLSPIAKSNQRKSVQQFNTPFIKFSTPTTSANNQIPKKINGKLIDSSMPILPEAVLRKLFPDETEDLSKLTPSLRAKLRKKLKKFLKNGYLPGDSQITQDRMEFWLQEISSGKNLTHKAKKNLLGSVSAALHSIADRVSDVTEAGEGRLGGSESPNTDDNAMDTEEVVAAGGRNIPELRKKRNKSVRKIKSLKNELKKLKRQNNAVIDLTGTIDEDVKPKTPRARRQPRPDGSDSKRPPKRTRANGRVSL